MLPNGLIDGGITGISIMLSTITHLKLSVWLILLNIPFFLLGYSLLGKRFLFRACFAMFIFTSLLEVFKLLPAIMVDDILACGAGGGILGLGVGFIIRYGGCLDGTEVIAILLSKKTELSVGKVVLFSNMLIYSISAILFGWDRALYSMGAYLFSYKIIDSIAEGLEQGKAVFVITKDAKYLVENIFLQLGRTTTWWEAEGYLSGTQKMIYIVVTRMEISELRRIIDEDDNSSFVTILDVADIIGNHIKKTKKNLIKERREARLRTGKLLKVD